MALPTRVNRGTYDPFELAQREFDNQLPNVYGGNRGGGGDVGTSLAPYGVDVREDADHIYVEAELPGFRKEDVDITLENQTLTITAQRTEQVAEGNGGNGGNGGQAGPGKTGQAKAGPQPPRPRIRPRALAVLNPPAPKRPSLAGSPT